MNLRIFSAFIAPTCICGSVTIGVWYFFSQLLISLASPCAASSMNGGVPDSRIRSTFSAASSATYRS